MTEGLRFIWSPDGFFAQAVMAVSDTWSSEDPRVAGAEPFARTSA